MFLETAKENEIVMAGLLERWQSKEGRVIESCALITSEAKDILQPIHPRMPVILVREQFTTWHDPRTTKLQSLL